jgi:hypothetical protein
MRELAIAKAAEVAYMTRRIDGGFVVKKGYGTTPNVRRSRAHEGLDVTLTIAVIRSAIFNPGAVCNREKYR